MAAAPELVRPWTVRASGAVTTALSSWLRAVEQARLLPGLVRPAALPDGGAAEERGPGEGGGDHEGTGLAREPVEETGRSADSDFGRQPAYGLDAGEHGRLQVRRRREGDGGGQPSGRGGEPGDVPGARRAVGQVPGERLVFVPAEGVEYVGRGEGVQFVFVFVLHVVTPMQSRSRISPSRIRVLIVGSGVWRVSATSR